MDRARAHPLPAHDPISGGPLVITELESVEGGVTIRGRFEVPRFARLSPDQARYLETFLRCRGMLNSVERELGISYPTARARLDAVLKALDLHAVREEPASAPEPPATPAPPEPSFPDMSPPEAPATPEPPTAWAEPQEPETPDAPPTYEPSTPAGDETPAYDPTGFEDDVPAGAAPKAPASPSASRDELLSMLERGEIGVEELKRRLEERR